MLQGPHGAMAKTSTIDGYLKTKPAEVRLILAQVRRTIGRAIPKATEGISYQIPAYRLGTSPVVFFAGWKEHYSLYPASAALVAEFQAELAPYSISKGTIRFPLSEKVPAALIARLAKFLFREATLRAAAKKSRKKTSTKKAPARRRARTG
jgi:uncharacterized protein YdhG (YjbR/CyaY superfamily)